MKRLFVILTLILVGTASSGYSQTIAVRPMDLSPTLDSLFTNGEFEQLEIVALRMLHPSRQATENERVAAHLYLGFVWELSRRSNDAQNAFLQALEIMPNLTLNQVYVPPVLYSAFNRAKNFKNAQSDVYVPVRQTVTPLQMPPKHLIGSFSNLIIPGTGFLVSGRQPLRGLFWMTAQAGCAYALYDAYKGTQNARDIYHAESDPTRIETRYDEYNDWNKILQTWSAVNATVYVMSQIDFQMSGFRVRALPLTTVKNQTPIIGMNLNFTW